MIEKPKNEIDSTKNFKLIDKCIVNMNIDKQIDVIIL